MGSFLLLGSSGLYRGRLLRGADGISRRWGRVLLCADGRQPARDENCGTGQGNSR